MDIQRFSQHLASFYLDWNKPSVQPKSSQFKAVLEQISAKTTAQVMQLLDFAVSCLEEDEVYLEIGCAEGKGGNLIGALLNHPEQLAYGLSSFSYTDQSSVEYLLTNLSTFNLEDQVLFYEQDWEDFFLELREIELEEKIGIYFYNSSHSYRSYIMGLLLVQPFLADQALIIINSNDNQETRKKAILDFINTYSECQLLINFSALPADVSELWNNIQILSWNNSNHHNSQQQEKKIEIFPEEREKAIADLRATALELYRSRNFAQAEQKYQEVLQLDRGQGEIWRDLSELYYLMERYQDASVAILKAIEIESTNAYYHYTLGIITEKIGDLAQAIKAYQAAIAFDPQLINAYNNLGNLFTQVGQLEQSELLYRQAIKVAPNQVGSYLNLGNLLLTNQQIDEAIAIYQQALQLNLHNADIFHNLGMAFKLQGKLTQANICFGNAAYFQRDYPTAINYYQKSLEKNILKIDIYQSLATCYRQIGSYEKAIKTYQEGISKFPQVAELYSHLTETLNDCGRNQEALKVISDAAKLIPDNLALKVANQLMLPILYQTAAEIDFYRQRFTKGIKTLREQIQVNNPATLAAIISPSYRLSYQGRNDLKLQTEYGKLVHQVMNANYPQWSQPLSMPSLEADGKIRIGYISDCLWWHVVARQSLGWLSYRDRQKFKVYCYSTNRKFDFFTQKFKLYADVFQQIPDDLEAICQQIQADKLHILVFLDLGIQPRLTQIAALRLAPIQCRSWGPPVTSGLPTMDYFLSSDLMESDDAEAHYSEKLVRLPNLGFAYSKPTIPNLTKTRQDFGIKEEAIVYLSSQSFHKYLPQYDLIFAEIANHIPTAQFVFLSHTNNQLTNKFRQRLQQAFTQFNLDSKNYCTILPRQDDTGYWNLNQLSDIFLDTFDWSGGHTTLDAIACSLPIVTCPGELLRSRHAYGILQRLGITNTVAQTKAEYVEIAIKLAMDIPYRLSIIEKIKMKRDNLYHDQVCITALEDFYKEWFIRKRIRENKTSHSKRKEDFKRI